MDQDVIYATNYLAENYKSSSAKTIFSSKNKAITIILSLILLGILYFYPNFVLKSVFLLGNILYLGSNIFKCFLFILGNIKKQDSDIKDDNVINYFEKDFQDQNLFPIYTILVPLYKEEKILASLIKNISAIDYPKEKLDVKFIIEEDDLATLNSLKLLEIPNFIDITLVPNFGPRTKPKACNFALKKAKGAFVTIYDAEDQPDRLQLKKALMSFMLGDEKLFCVQSKLNYYNKDRNYLTQLFSIEYYMWFNFLLPALEKIGAAVTLGGTSNHFKTKLLQEIGAWDPYNVTEDADLGIRIKKLGYSTTVIESTTLEEAPARLISWLKQRSRWIKGYMQTFLVHLREPMTLLRKLGIIGIISFIFFVGVASFAYLLVPFIILILLINKNSFFTDYQTLIEINLIIAIFIPIITAFITVAKSKWSNMQVAILLFPFYYILHSIASIKSFWELIFNPHYWDKTSHGND